MSDDCFKTVNRKNTNSVKWDMIDGDYVSFSVADSDYLTPKFIVERIQNRLEHGVFGYTFVDDEFYKIVSKWVKRRYHYDLYQDEMVQTSGIVSSLNYAIKMLNDKSDSVVIQTPVYYMFYPLVNNSGKKLKENALINNNGHWEMDLENLEEIFKEGCKIMILCNPHNPVGRTYTKQELLSLVNLAKKYDVYILSDEIHCDFIMDGYEFHSLNTFSNIYDKIMVFFAPSKTFNIAGLKISIVSSKNKQLIELYKNTIEKAYYGTTSLLSIEALKAAYTSCDEWLIKQNEHISNNYNLLVNHFKTHHKDVIVSKNEATYLAWIDLRCLGKTCEELYQDLLKEGVLIAGGLKYAEQCNGFVRLNFACSEEQLLTGLNRITNYINKL